MVAGVVCWGKLMWELVQQNLYTTVNKFAHVHALYGDMGCTTFSLSMLVWIVKLPLEFLVWARKSQSKKLNSDSLFEEHQAELFRSPYFSGETYFSILNTNVSH